MDVKTRQNGYILQTWRTLFKAIMSGACIYYVFGFNGFKQFTDLVEKDLSPTALLKGEHDAAENQTKLRLSFLRPTRLRCLSCLLFSWSSTFSVEDVSQRLVSRGYERPTVNSSPFPESAAFGTDKDNLYFTAADRVSVVYPGSPRCFETTPLAIAEDAVNRNISKHFIITNREEVFICHRKKSSENANWMQNYTINRFQISEEFSVKNVSCGKEHTLLLTNSGRVYAFGTGSKGQLGLGTLESHKEPVYVDALEPLAVKAIYAGGWHSLALTDTGDLYSWGWNQSGQLGVGCFPEEDSWGSQRPCCKGQACKRGLFGTLPSLVDLSSDVTSISCGSRHSAAVLRGNSVWTWGWNGYGQLGHGDKEDRHCPVRVEGFDSEGSSSVKVVCNAWNTVVCLSTKEVG